MSGTRQSHTLEYLHLLRDVLQTASENNFAVRLQEPEWEGPEAQLLREIAASINALALQEERKARVWQGARELSAAIAQGDFTKKLVIQDEPQNADLVDLADSLNGIVDFTNCFAFEATKLARELGTAGTLGGQMDVAGARGTWKDLQDNINFMAANLSTQLRGMALVTKVTSQGDYNHKLTVEAGGEVLELIQNLNVIVENLHNAKAQ